MVDAGVNPLIAAVELGKNALPSTVTVAAGEPAITPGGHVAVAVGTAAFTVRVTVTVRVLLTADGALILMVPVYTFGVSPVGSTVTATVLSRPMTETFPLGVTFSQFAPETLSVAETAAPLLERMNALVSDGLGTGFPVVYVNPSDAGVV